MLHTWARNRSKNLKFKNNLFGATNIVKNNDQEKYVYSGYGITFDGTGSWSFNPLNTTGRIYTSQ